MIVEGCRIDLVLCRNGFFYQLGVRIASIIFHTLPVKSSNFKPSIRPIYGFWSLEHVFFPDLVENPSRQTRAAKHKTSVCGARKNTIRHAFMRDTTYFQCVSMSRPCYIMEDEQCLQPHVQSKTHNLTVPKPANNKSRNEA